jgi:hypothetical protein
MVGKGQIVTFNTNVVPVMICSSDACLIALFPCQMTWKIRKRKIDPAPDNGSAGITRAPHRYFQYFKPDCMAWTLPHLSMSDWVEQPLSKT